MTSGICGIECRAFGAQCVCGDGLPRPHGTGLLPDGPSGLDHVLYTAFFSGVNRYGVRGLVPALVVFGNERRRRQTTQAAPGRSTWFPENAWQRPDGGARLPKLSQVAALHKRTRF
jgi:hypothetical protein